MIIRKCDVCSKILEKKDDYYSVDEVTFNKGDRHYVGNLDIYKQLLNIVTKGERHVKSQKVYNKADKKAKKNNK
jgi:hypothetical protein